MVRSYCLIVFISVICVIEDCILLCRVRLNEFLFGIWLGISFWLSENEFCLSIW